MKLRSLFRAPSQTIFQTSHPARRIYPTVYLHHLRLKVARIECTHVLLAENIELAVRRQGMGPTDLVMLVVTGKARRWVFGSLEERYACIASSTEVLAYSHLLLHRKSSSKISNYDVEEVSPISLF